MSTRLKIKGALLAAFVILSVVIMGFTLASMQDGLSIESCQADIQREMEELPGLLEEADAETAQNTETFDAIYQSKAESVAFMANHDTGFEATDAKMAEYKELLGVDNVLVVDRSGAVVARAQDALADFSYQRYNLLRTVFDTGEPSAAMEVEFADQGTKMRYYSARIDDNTMAVIEQNPAELDGLVANTGSLSSVLSGVSVGQNGYVFAMSAKNYVIEYHPNAELIGTDALDDGIHVEDLEDGTFTWVKMGDDRFYCGISEIGDSYYISAIPESDMTASRNLTVGVILFIFFSVAMVVALYGFFVMREDEKRGYNPENYVEMGPLRFNKAIGKKAIVLSFVGFLAVMLVTFYMQTLFSLSSESVSSNERAADIESTIDRTNAQADTLIDQYNERYLSKANTVAYILEQNDSLKNREDLQELADTIQVQYLYVFNADGVLTATNSPYSNFVLSEDPENQSYAFRSLLQGVEYIVQEPMPEEVSGELRQYIGVTMRNTNNEADGFVQLSIRPERLETLLSSVQIDTILDGVKLGQGGFAFAVNKSDGAFAYYPDEKLQGTSAVSAGLDESQLKGNFSDFLTINGTKYYASSFETDDYYVYVAQPESELMTDRVPLTLATGANGVVCQIIIFLLVTFEIRRKQTDIAQREVPEDGDEPSRTFETTMPDGRRAKTESAASRWIYSSMHWGDKSAEQRVLTVLKFLTASSPSRCAWRWCSRAACSPRIPCSRTCSPATGSTA